MYLFGGNGHCKVIVDIITKATSKTIKAIFDDKPKCESIASIPVLKPESLAVFKNKELIISIGSNLIRKQIASKIEAHYVTAIHPSAILAYDVVLKEGTVVMAGAILNPAVTIGKHCIINSGAIVEHDCVLEDFVHLSPNATLAGNVRIGEGSHVGIGACVIQGVQVGKWVTIGAGAVVLNNVPDYAVLVGNPGKIVKYNSIENE